VKTSSLVFLLWFGVAVFWGAVTIAYSAGWRINHTNSLPLGLWRGHAAEGPITRGQIVSFCPPDGCNRSREEAITGGESEQENGASFLREKSAFMRVEQTSAHS
jgi:type IV secretory pathway protease TraF